MYARVESFEWGDLHIQALAPHVAVVTTTFDFAATDTTGAPIAVNGTSSTVWLQADGEWKIVNTAETFPARTIDRRDLDCQRPAHALWHRPAPRRAVWTYSRCHP